MIEWNKELERIINEMLTLILFFSIRMTSQLRDGVEMLVVDFFSASFSLAPFLTKNGSHFSETHIFWACNKNNIFLLAYATRGSNACCVRAAVGISERI